MDFSADQLLTLAAGGAIGIAALYLYHQATRRKETIIYKVKLLLTSAALYLGGMLILTNMGYPPSTVLVGGILLGISAKLIVKRPRDARYIPKGVKQAVIKRDLADGEEYDSSRYHFDHIVPFSRGGDTSVRNLRLLAKEKNLRRGAKRPRLKDFL
jgi:hypothetical protein